MFKDLKLNNFLMLTIAGIINACGVMFFFMPVSLFDGGISGTSQFLDKITPAYLTISIFLLVLNIPLFLYGLKKQGIIFTIYSIYTIIIYSLMTAFITMLFPTITKTSPFAGEDMLLCSIFGGILSGIGSGLTIRYGGAIDGIEVLGVIFAKKIGITIGVFVMIYNVIQYIIIGITFGLWIIPLYSIIAYYINSKTVDYITDGFDRAKCAMIITNKKDEICYAVSKEFESGLTTTIATSFYSKENKDIIYFVVNRFQISKLKSIVHEIDNNAYIIISEVTDVFSNSNK